MWKYIIACLFIAIVWVAWFFGTADIVEASGGSTEFSLWTGGYMWVPALATALVVVAFIALYIVRKIRARKAARELEKALAAQAAQHARGARADNAAELQAIRQDFEDALGEIKDSRLGRQGENPLYALPWHLIIGPPGAGKSTALRNSGLQFPFRQDAIKGVGGTRNCDWWLTNDGILLDTAGRWTTEDQDRDEWVTFLDMLKKNRPKRPLDGVIAAVSLTDLASAHEDEIAALAAKVRTRVDEVLERLSMSLPVYVLFTKCDLLPGFVETFNHLSKSERGALWGTTFPVGMPMPDGAGAAFTERFEKLAQDSEDRSLGRIAAERRLDDREMIYAFPQQFQSVGRNAAEFLNQLFEPNSFGDTPLMRGTYFTSGTQEGRPIDLVMSRMAEAFGIRSELPTGETKDPKSYFLHDVFKKVIFRDGAIAGWSPKEVERRKRTELWASSCIFAIALLMSSIPAYAYMNNRDFVTAAADEVRAARAIVDAGEQEGTEAEVLGLEEVEPLRSRTALLNEYRDDNEPTKLGFGMYVGDDLVAPVNKLYAEILRRRVLQPIVSDIEQNLRSFGETYAVQENQQPTTAEQQANYSRLESYLLLTQPKAEGEPAASGALGERLAGQVVTRWASETEGDVDDAARERMSANVQTFVGSLEGDVGLAFDRDERVVDRARAALNRITLSRMGLSRLENNADESFSPITLGDLIGNTVPIISSMGEVPAAYTLAAWDGYVRDLLATPDDHLVGEPWVLGRDPAEGESPQELAANLKSQYFREYIVRWQEFLRSITVSPPSGNTESLAALQDLTRGTPTVYGRLFRAVYRQVNLEVAASDGQAGLEAAAESAFDAVRRRAATSVLGRAASAGVEGQLGGGGSGSPDQLLTELDVAAAFEGFTSFGVPPAPPAGQNPPPTPPPTGLDGYGAQIAAVRDALQTYLDSPGDPSALTEALQGARTSVMSLVETQEVGWRPRFEALLWPPIDGASMSSTQAVATGAGRSWCAEVATPFYAGLHDRYPFNPDGVDVPLADFAAFFKPGGTLWAFYDEALQHSVTRDGGQFDFAQQFGRRGHFNRVLLTYLGRAQALTSSFFPVGADAPSVSLDVRVIPSPEVADIEFSLGGASVTHRNGPEEWTRMAWPGESPEVGAMLEIRGADGLHEEVGQSGEWGLFHLLEAGSVTEGGPGSSVFRVTWHLRTHNVNISVDIRPVRGQTPFFDAAAGTSNSDFMAPVRGSALAAPRNIVANRRVCNI